MPPVLEEIRGPRSALRDFTTLELLAILVGGPATAELDATADLIDAGDRTIASTDPHELVTLTCLPDAAASIVASAFELARRATAPGLPPVVRGPADVAAIARRHLAGLRRERLLAIVCDPANRPLRTLVVADGAIDRCTFPVREILRAVLGLDGRAFALAHNHPYGDAHPSDADLDATRAVATAARLVGLRFLGHVVIGEHDWSSITPPMPRTPG